VPSPHKYKLKKSKLESPLNSAKAAKKGKCPPLERGEKTSAFQKSKGAEAAGFASAGQHTGCDVCSGTSMTDCFNRLLSCGRCAVKVMPDSCFFFLGLSYKRLFLLIED
jgi:hypothetical protein